MSITHKNIADLFQSIGKEVEKELDFSIHFLPDIHKQTPYQSPLFRADYFTFVYVKDGCGNYTIDDKKFEFKPNSVYFTNPGHLKTFYIESTKDAYLISFTESFLIEYIGAHVFEEFPFILAEVAPPKQLSSDEFGEFEQLYKQIFKEFKSDSIYKHKIIANLMLVILLKSKEKFWSSYNPIEEGLRNSEIVKTFKLLLDANFKQVSEDTPYAKIWNVQDYANALSLHPNYLSSVIKSKTGKTVNSWISERVLATAKSLLINSSLSAKEIAFKLGFSEATHFGRFFKKQTHTTPASFRKTHRK
ncbi:MAG: AraC family transcriptional regulator [Marinifilaceae bacterium]|jgi:AraC-like DNA-binding protein|nr:AraC family transcriptional regulator [Marinifilaceae bacterium]